jgi:hypothetical protein
MHEMHGIVKLRHLRTQHLQIQTNSVLRNALQLAGSLHYRIRVRQQVNTQRRSFIRPNRKIARGDYQLRHAGLPVRTEKLWMKLDI